jgi:hypothetical protein
MSVAQLHSELGARISDAGSDKLEHDGGAECGEAVIAMESRASPHSPLL